MTTGLMTNRLFVVALVFVAAHLTAAEWSFLHLSDLHFDQLSDVSKYDPSNFCRDPKINENMTLAQWKSFVKKHPSAVDKRRHHHYGAYPYGRHGCDTVPSLLYSLLSHADGLKHSALPPKFAIVTGDFAAHFQPSKDEDFDAIADATNVMRQGLPGLPIFRVVGNNDVYEDYAATCKMSRYYDLYHIWSDTIPIESKYDFYEMGAYSAELQPGLRLVALNTVLYADRDTKESSKISDPCGQLAWLEGQLADSKRKSEKVVIASHIPPNLWDQLHDAPRAGFLALLEKYEDTIAANLFGHTHSDDLVTFQSEKFTALIAPSVTPLTVNPSYRNIVVSDDFNFQDYTHYYMDLRSPSPSWQAEYQWRSAYGVPDLTPASILAVGQKLVSNSSLFGEFNQRSTVQFVDARAETLCTASAENETAYYLCYASLAT